MALAPFTLSLEDAWDGALKDHVRSFAASELAESGPEPLTQYQPDPIGFCVDVLGDRREMFVWSEAGPEYETHHWDGTPNPLAAIFAALAAGRNTACLSGTGVGKSALAARAGMWFLGSFKYARVPTYAPRKDQLTDYMWAEMGKLWPKFSRRFPSAILQDGALYMDGKSKDRELWSASAIAVQRKAGETISTRAAGIHAEHMMLVLEEVEGIDPATIEALENTCTAPHNFFFAPGNPNSKTGTLYKLSKRPSWVSVTASALDHPNVVCDDPSIVPGAVSRESIVNRAEKYDVPMVDGMYDFRSPLANPMFRSRVCGIPPEQSPEALLRMEWVQAAIDHAARVRSHIQTLGLPHALGADPANSPRGDPAGLAHFIGPVCVTVITRPCPDSNDFGDDVWRVAVKFDILPQHIGVDPIGVGAGTVNTINRLVPKGCLLQNLARMESHVEKPNDGPQWTYDVNLFHNARAQQHWQLMMDLQWSAKRTIPLGKLFDEGSLSLDDYWQRTRACIGLPNNAEMIEELTAVHVLPTNTGKTLLEPKEDVRDRIGRSPNSGDSVVAGNYVRDRTFPKPVLSLNPDAQSLGWKKGPGGKLRPVEPMDLDQGRQRQLVAAGRPKVTKWW